MPFFQRALKKLTAQAENQDMDFSVTTYGKSILRDDVSDDDEDPDMSLSAQKRVAANEPTLIEQVRSVLGTNGDLIRAEGALSSLVPDKSTAVCFNSF